VPVVQVPGVVRSLELILFFLILFYNCCGWILDVKERCLGSEMVLSSMEKHLSNLIMN
jgi:hypothetical protein